MVDSCLSPRGTGFSLRLVRVGFVVDKIALVQVFRQLLQLSPGSIINFILSAHSFICHGSSIILANGCIVKYYNLKQHVPKSSPYHICSSLLQHTLYIYYKFIYEDTPCFWWLRNAVKVYNCTYFVTSSMLRFPQMFETFWDKPDNRGAGTCRIVVTTAASEHYILSIYRGADKSLARPGRKQATATEDFEFHISYL
jgi:hypothetical protein